MTAKTRRMEQIEAMLVDDPNDEFLLYGLAMEYASMGDEETALAKYRVLTDRSEGTPYVPAFLQAGQVLMRLGRDKEAAAMLKRGIQAASQTGDAHAKGEMEGFLSTLE